jgi:hypothetical protein
MNERRLRLALKRERLVERSRALRREAVAQSAALEPMLRVGDRIRSGADWVRANPGTVAAFVVGIAVIRPRRAWRWGMRLWSGWRLLQRLQDRLAAR